MINLKYIGNKEGLIKYLFGLCQATKCNNKVEHFGSQLCERCTEHLMFS